ncbi:MAG: divalent-cation tolerance protein CutA [Acidobacteriota bacterium]
MSSDARIVLTTAGSADECRKLGRMLVEEKLAACATVIPQVESIYRWQGQVETAGEALMLLKTEAAQIERLEQRLRELHTYETPEFLVVEVEGGSAAYLEWLRQSVAGS